MTAIAIRTENLTRDFAAVRALDGLNLEVARGAQLASDHQLVPGDRSGARFCERCCRLTLLTFG